MARRELWRRLAGEEQNERFFNLIGLLRNTSEFRFARADLTRRLWEVISAACENTELRDLLFLEAETHGTCADGRILTFSQLETRVFTYHALRNIPPGNAVLKGRALLPLLRRLFRLYRVDTLAEHRAIQRHSDIAEVRLEYRIGLTNGWDDGLDLPGQPAHMLYGTPISEARAAKVRASILEAERSDALSLFMATQDFWKAHLAERYPQEFSAINTALDDERLEVFNALEARNERGEFNEADYPVEMREAMDTIEDKRNQQLAELTRREIEVLQPTAGDPEIPAPRSPQPGPSRLP
nr:NEL domain-containing protein [Pseudomonas anatoliensis]